MTLQSKRTLEQIEAEIASVKKELEDTYKRINFAYDKLKNNF